MGESTRVASLTNISPYSVQQWQNLGYIIKLLLIHNNITSSTVLVLLLLGWGYRQCMADRGRGGGVGIQSFLLFFLFNFNSTVHPIPQPPFIRLLSHTPPPLIESPPPRLAPSTGTWCIINILLDYLLLLFIKHLYTGPEYGATGQSKTPSCQSGRLMIKQL